MDIKKLLIRASVIYITYKSGWYIGHVECLFNLKRKYGDKIFDESGKLVDQLSKNTHIAIFKGKKGE